MPKKRSYNRKVEHSGRTNSRLVTAGYFVALSAFAFLVAFLSSSHFAPTSESSAEAGTYYTNISSSGEVELDFISTPDGVAKIGKDTLSVTTNATEGYKLYISTVSTASSNGLCLENDATKCVVASTGTPENPKKLAVNTWGYVPSRASSSDTASTYTGGDVDAVSGQAIIRGVPTYGHEDVLYVNSTPSVAAANSLDVYYGANVSTALPSGAYSNTVVYTAITDAPNPSSTPATIAPVSQTGLGAGEDLVVTTSLYPGLSVDNIGTISVKIGDDDCTNVTPSLGTGGELKISCKTPAKASAGTYTVAVYVAKYNKTYELSGAYEYVNSTPEFFTITKMQEMTRAICQDTEVPTPARDANTALTKSAWESGTRTGIPTTTLLDDRGNPKVSYTVKKLADGQCWMTENLALPGGTVLSSDDSDIDGTVVSSYTVPTSLGDSAFSNSPAQDVAQMTDYYVDTQVSPNNYLEGGHYSWRAATAGTGRGSDTDGGAANDVFGTNMNTKGNNTAVSICPKGWRLPTSGSGAGTSAATSPGSTVGLTNGDFTRLYQAYSGDTTTSGNDTTMYSQMTGTSYGPQLALGGGVYKSARSGQGSNGQYWSSTVYSYRAAYRLYLNTGYVNSQFYDNTKYVGYSVRCIAR